MALLVSIFFGFFPMFLYAAFINWIDRYEKEPKALLGAAFLWGVVIAAGGAFIINTVFGIGIYIFTGSEDLTNLGTASVVAPVVEEILKGLAVAIVFLMFRKEFDSILDGIIYGGIAGLGFAATENTIYIYRGYLESGWGGLIALVVIRVILVGWMHAFFTAFTGIGFAVARLNKNMLIKITAPFIGLSLAIFTHAFHNTFGNFFTGLAGLAATVFSDSIGYALMFGFIIWMIVHERNIVKRQLIGEVSAGLISQAQYQKAMSPWNLTTAGMSGRATSRFYHALGELAHKKEQFQRHGEEGGNSAIITSLRQELANLAPQAK
ncbi:MAG: PrsW family intramembrane metalloprotease [Anaerolineales bacterium]|nr:PrsW family intramembrane metalloprotease [Anaerolineales bacterium]